MLPIALLACRDAPPPPDTTPTADTGGEAPLPLPAPLPFDGDHALVVPHGTGVSLLDASGAAVWRRTWTELVGSCALCGGEGASADGDGLLLSFTTEGPTRGGGVARLTAAGDLDWRVDGFAFPHDAVRDPLDDTVIVPEVNGSRLTWIAGDGSSNAPVRALSPGTPDWPGNLPNGAERFDHAGRRYVLVSHRGIPAPPTTPGGPEQPTGSLSLWDVTAVPAAHVWTFPEDGALDVPHGAVFRVVDGAWWLLWAHTRGAERGGTVGLAVTDDPTVLPAYVADLEPEGAAAPFDFLRGVELAADGTLWLTDSGPGNGVGSFSPSGRLLRVPFPAGLSPTGASGAVGRDQVLVPIDPDVVAEGLDNPFEGWLWRPSFPLGG